MPLSTGVANCEHCGATVGTLFSEADFKPVDKKGRRHAALTAHSDLHDRIATAQERANNSLILALSSFFCPGVGFLLGVAAIVLGALAVKTLKANSVEDGRGSASAGLIIGVLGLVAQGGYVVYFINAGKLPLVG